MFTLIELCCGSAALSLHLLGARRHLLPYQGSKWRFRHALARILRGHGARGPASRLELTDPGPWGTVAGCVIDPGSRAGILDRLRAMNDGDARELYDSLHGHPIPDDPVDFSAQYLFLQRLAYSGKAVGVREARWSSPGFNTSSAYGLPGTDRFGQVKPMIPSLIRTLESYGRLAAAGVRSRRTGAPFPESSCTEPTFVYLDPPYAGSTRYPNGELDRDEVVRLAQAWHEAGARVLVSEGEPLPELLRLGWSKRHLHAGRNDTSPFRGQQEEWLTVSP